MREILFRGRRSWGNKEWVEGDVLHGYSNHVSITKRLMGIETWQVEPETLGLYTGLCDKNGKKIFEGDIVQYELHGIRNRAVIKYGAPKEDSACYGWYLDDNHGNTAFLFSKNFIEVYECEVIGNIHDNPELIGGV